jgi:hypothetical protein
MTPQAITARRARRCAAACGRVDTAFLAEHAVRYEPAATAPADCVPMVQLLTIWSRESLCEDAVPLLREIDWGAVRRAIGW